MSSRREICRLTANGLLEGWAQKQSHASGKEGYLQFVLAKRYLKQKGTSSKIGTRPCRLGQLALSLTYARIAAGPH